MGEGAAQRAFLAAGDCPLETMIYPPSHFIRARGGHEILVHASPLNGLSEEVRRGGTIVNEDLGACPA